MYTMPMSTTTMFMTTMSMSERGCLAERGKKKMELKKGMSPCERTYNEQGKIELHQSMDTVRVNCTKGTSQMQIGWCCNFKSSYWFR